MSRRFFVSAPVTENRVQLGASERQHLVQALRGREGDHVVLFDGSGFEFTARVVGISRSSVDLEVLARHDIDRELGAPITLGVALPKGDRQRWLIEKAAELGVACLVPLVTERGVAQPVSKVIERLTRYVIEAAKQCGRNRLMQVASPLAAADFFERAPSDSLRVVAHPGHSAVPIVSLAQPAGDTSIYLAVGPEGGFTDDEVRAATAWHVVSLGRRILRVETAALALTAYFSLTDASGRDAMDHHE